MRPFVSLWDAAPHHPVCRLPAGKRAPQAFLSTDTALAPAEIIAIFVRCWQVEVTFSKVRAHLGVETQRQWPDNAIERTTPALMGLHSLITLWAGELLRRGATPYAAAWYRERADNPAAKFRKRPSSRRIRWCAWRSRSNGPGTSARRMSCGSAC
jgi:hypothetical protein